MTYGAGFFVGGVDIDYAYQPFDQLGDTHRLGISVGFDRGLSRVSPAPAPTSTRRPADAAPAVPKDTPAPAPAAAQADATPKAAPAAPKAAPAKTETVQAAPKTPPAAAPAEKTAPVGSPDTKPIEGPVAVVAGVHKTRFSALEELRMLRITGYHGGEVRRLDDGRYQVLVKTFKNASEAQSWIDGAGREYGSQNFTIIELR